MNLPDHDLESMVLAKRFHQAFQDEYLKFMAGHEDEYSAKEGSRIAIAALIPTFAGACKAWHQLVVNNGTHEEFSKRIKNAILGVLNQELGALCGSEHVTRDDSSLRRDFSGDQAGGSGSN